MPFQRESGIIYSLENEDKIDSTSLHFYILDG